MTPSEPRKAGRPTTDPAARRVHSSYTLSPGVLELLDRLVERMGLSKSAIVEIAIRRLAEQERGR